MNLPMGKQLSNYTAKHINNKWIHPKYLKKSKTFFILLHINNIEQQS